MAKIILHDCYIGDYPTTQIFGVNYDTYKWILDINGNPIKGHNGWDIGMPTGTKLINPFPNGDEVVVTYVGWDPKGYGNYLRMWNKTQGFVMLYAHCQQVVVSVGQTLSFQQLVAISDNTGWSTGDHCHIGGYYVDKDGNKLNRDNGFDGWVNILSKDVVTWKVLSPTDVGVTTNTSITIPGELYEKLVEGSTIRKDVAAYLGYSEPDTTPFKDIQSSIGGFKSQITTLQNGLTEAQTEVKNREEQVERIKQTSEATAKTQSDRIEALEVAQKSWITERQSLTTQLDTMAKEKGAMAIETANAKAALVKEQAKSCASMRWIDALKLLVKKSIPFRRA